MYNLSDIEELVDNLNTTIWRLDNEHRVFDGKCCFISYVIAKNLEERSIPFKTVVYSHVQNPDIHQLVKDEEMTHVTIEISYGNKKFLIGDNVVDDTGLEKSYFRLTSEDLINLYETGSWNDGHSGITDEEIEEELDMTFLMVLG